jgi:hypothetical protein
MSMKSARDRPSSNLGFNLQTSESKPPRDRSQQAVAQQHHYAQGSGKADRAHPLGAPLHNSFFNLPQSSGNTGNQTMVVSNKLLKQSRQQAHQ